MFHKTTSLFNQTTTEPTQSTIEHKKTQPLEIAKPTTTTKYPTIKKILDEALKNGKIDARDHFELVVTDDPRLIMFGKGPATALITACMNTDPVELSISELLCLITNIAHSKTVLQKYPDLSKKIIDTLAEAYDDIKRQQRVQAIHPRTPA
ncbi:MAG: hypothetical protein ACYCQI_01440 [Gammaproteobacteria bacterium]